MLQVRKGVFETNSSSTHSLTLFSKEEWEAFKNNPDMLITAKGSFISRSAAKTEIKNNFYGDSVEITDDDLNEDGYYDYNDIEHGWSGAKHLELPDGSAVVSIYHSGY